MLDTVDPDPTTKETQVADNDFTDAQVQLLSTHFTGQADRVEEIVSMLTEYVDAGGRDRATFERLLDGLAREGMSMAMYARGVLDPDQAAKATKAVDRAAGTTKAKNSMRDHLHRQVATAVVAGAWVAGEHHLVDPDEWPSQLAPAALKAVRTASRINADPLMTNLD